MKIKNLIASSLLLMMCLFFNQHLSALCWCNMWDQSPCSESDYAYNASRWSASVFGGANPTAFIEHRTDDLFYVPTPPRIPFPVVVDSTRYQDQFHMPWTAGVELGYMYCDDWEVFIDFAYNFAASKDHKLKDSVLNQNVIFEATKYRSYDYHIGVRHYFDTVLCYITPFIGGKVGVTHRQGIHINETIVTSTNAVSTFFDIPLYDRTTTVSGGFHIGLNWALTCNIAVTLKVEAILSGDWRSFDIPAPTPNPLGLPTIVPGNNGALIEFPATLGLRFSF